MNILITSAGRRVGLVNAFKLEVKKIFSESKVYTVDSNPEWSSACRVSDGSFNIPKVNHKNYIIALLKICKEKEIKIVIPTIDTELLALSKAKELFANNNIYIIVSDYELIFTCRDKRLTNLLFQKLDIKIPNPIDKKNPTFPLFIKPYDGSLSKDIYHIKNESELTYDLLNNPKLMFMEFISSMDYQEYSIDAYYDKNNFLKCIVPRCRLEIRGGEISKGKTEKKYFYDVLKNKFKYLPGAIGCFTIQFFIGKIKNEIIGIEINPRFGGGYPLSYAAGANYPKYIIKEYLFNENIPFYENWVENRVMLRYDSEIILDENEFSN